jgi:hypothetical protein
MIQYKNKIQKNNILQRVPYLILIKNGYKSFSGLPTPSIKKQCRQLLILKHKFQPIFLTQLKN